jgi:hypothetical protein
MKDTGFPISQATYSRMKRKLQDQKLSRLYHIAKIGFSDNHLATIDKLELIEQLMWKDHSECKDPFKRACIKEKIANIQPYLSAYYEATKDIMENTKDVKTIETDNIS